jgi:dTDP-4-amino-4,6-dideoxygalactose transaminase
VGQELDRLAIEGGPKAVPQPLERYKGAAVIGDEEREAVLEVLASRSLFRYYGPNLLGKVAQFEREFATYLGVPYVLACT